MSGRAGPDTSGARPGTPERIYAIGDVHGRYDLFRRLMNIIERDQATRDPAITTMILLGDIVDRGLESASMVRGCMKLTAFTDRFVVLKGNHEQMMVEALQGSLFVYRQWLTFGGKETLLSWGVDLDVVEGPATRESLRIAAAIVGKDIVQWLADLPLYHRHGDYLFVHAGIRPGVALAKQRADDMLWITDEFLDSDVPHGMIVVHGHSISEDGAVVRPNRIGIDTGAYRTEQLTALGIEADRTWLLQTRDKPVLELTIELTIDDVEVTRFGRHRLAHGAGFCNRVPE
jgi:serine/threonine protein phosphatase 1